MSIHTEVKACSDLGRSAGWQGPACAGVVDIVQDVPLAGPLNRREIEDLEVRGFWSLISKRPL